jgi:hypothetical protein
MYFCKKINLKSQFVFHCGNSRKVFHDLPSLLSSGPREILCYKAVAVRARNKMVSVGSSWNSCAAIGRSQLPQHDMPRNKSELEAESKQNPPDLENRFIINGCTTVWTEALRWAILNGKKGFATISLDLIYHSIILSQLPSRETFPLRKNSK